MNQIMTPWTAFEHTMWPLETNCQFIHPDDSGENNKWDILNNEQGKIRQGWSVTHFHRVGYTTEVQKSGTHIYLNKI